MIQTSFERSLIRADSCSPAEMTKSLISKLFDEQCSEQPSKTAKRVRFNTQLVVRTTVHINDFSQKEIEDTWYQKADYEIMHRTSAETIKKLENGEYFGDTDNHCAGGLESRLRICDHRRRMRDLDSIYAVLEEHQRQRYEKDANAMALSAVYIQTVGSASHEAFHRGQVDTEEAISICAGKESPMALTFKGNRLVGGHETCPPRSGKEILNLFRRSKR